MNSDKWESWLQIASTLAVLIGIVLVVLQLRQNAELIELQILKDDSNIEFQVLHETLPDHMHEIWQKAFDNPDDLTLMEYGYLDLNLWAATINRWRGLYDLAERGLLEDSAWQRSVDEGAASMLAFPAGRAYWNRIKDVIELPPDLVESVDKALADAPENFPKTRFEDFKRRLEAAK